MSDVHLFFLTESSFYIAKQSMSIITKGVKEKIVNGLLKISKPKRQSL